MSGALKTGCTEQAEQINPKFSLDKAIMSTVQFLCWYGALKDSIHTAQRIAQEPKLCAWKICTKKADESFRTDELTPQSSATMRKSRLD